MIMSGMVRKIRRMVPGPRRPTARTPSFQNSGITTNKHTGAGVTITPTRSSELISASVARALCACRVETRLDTCLALLTKPHRRHDRGPRDTRDIGSFAEPDIIALRGLVPARERLIMPCFLLLVVLLSPRIALALMWFFSTYLQRAFHGGFVLPVLGFIFLPLTTIVYAWELNSGMPTEGINLLWLLIAVIIDLGGLGGGAHRQSRR